MCVCVCVGACECVSVKEERIAARGWVMVEECNGICWWGGGGNFNLEWARQKKGSCWPKERKKKGLSVTMWIPLSGCGVEFTGGYHYVSGLWAFPKQEDTDYSGLISDSCRRSAANGRSTTNETNGTNGTNGYRRPDAWRGSGGKVRFKSVGKRVSGWARADPPEARCAEKCICYDLCYDL